MNKLIKITKNVCTVYLIRIKIFAKTWSCINAYLCFIQYKKTYIFQIQLRQYYSWNRWNFNFFFHSKYFKIEYLKWKSKLTFFGEKFSQYFTITHFVFRRKCELFQALNRCIKCFTASQAASLKTKLVLNSYIYSPTQ